MDVQDAHAVRYPDGQQLAGPGRDTINNQSTIVTRMKPAEDGCVLFRQTSVGNCDTQSSDTRVLEADWLSRAGERLARVLGRLQQLAGSLGRPLPGDQNRRHRRSKNPTAAAGLAATRGRGLRQGVHRRSLCFAGSHWVLKSAN